MKRNIIFGVAVLAALVAVGCGRQSPPPAGQVSQPANVISVSEKEWSITLAPNSVSAGTYTFNVKNDGSIEHDFVIQGQNVRLEGIQAGQTKQVTVALKPGTCTVLCDIPGHAEAGMKTTLTVKKGV